MKFVSPRWQVFERTAVLLALVVSALSAYFTWRNARVADSNLEYMNALQACVQVLDATGQLVGSEESWIDIVTEQQKSRMQVVEDTLVNEKQWRDNTNLFLSAVTKNSGALPNGVKEKFSKFLVLYDDAKKLEEKARVDLNQIGPDNRVTEESEKAIRDNISKQRVVTVDISDQCFDRRKMSERHSQ